MNAQSASPIAVGNTAVVTGAASGMGRAMALRFGASGMNVVLADVNHDGLVEVGGVLETLDVEPLVVTGDVSTAEANQSLHDEAMERFGSVDVVCLNAGVTGAIGPSWELTEDDWDWSLGVLLRGVIHGVRSFVPGLVAQNQGHVVITASIAGHVSSPFSGPYMVAKHGVASLAETLYHELTIEGSNVGVTCLCPGFVNTDIVAAAQRRGEGDQGATTHARGLQWLERSGKALETGREPDEVADMVHDAIVDKQFWLFTDEMWDQAIEIRCNEVVNRLPPTIGRPSLL